MENTGLGRTRTYSRNIFHCQGSGSWLACPVGFHHCYRWTSSDCGLTTHSFPKACVCCGVSCHWFLLSSCMSRSKGATCGSGVVKSTRLCLTLCNPVDCSLPGSSVHGILQARMLEWESLFQRIFPTQGSNPGLEPRSPTLQVDSLPSEPPGKWNFYKNSGVVSLILWKKLTCCLL